MSIVLTAVLYLHSSHITGPFPAFLRKLQTFLNSVHQILATSNNIMAGNRDHTPDYTYICPLSEEEREVQALGYP
jgi:hypothetical protein